ncbi:MAG: hypothetical protein ACLFV4_08285 [Candidatus Hydrogenedentota bacterium]
MPTKYTREGFRSHAKGVRWQLGPSAIQRQADAPLVGRPGLLLFLGIAAVVFLLVVSQNLLEAFQTAEEPPSASAVVADKWRETDEQGATVYKLQISLENWPGAPEAGASLLTLTTDASSWRRSAEGSEVLVEYEREPGNGGVTVLNIRPPRD